MLGCMWWVAGRDILHQGGLVTTVILLVLLELLCNFHAACINIAEMRKT